MAKITKQVLVMRYIARALRALEFGGEPPSLDPSISWESVYELANRHSLAGAIWYILEPEVRKCASEELCRRWEKTRSVEFAKNLVQTSEFRRLTALFSESGIPFLPMKGFLLKELWSRPEYRTMGDMDFCVKETDMPRVSELLLKNGFTVCTEGQVVHDTFDKPPYIHVEIHKMIRLDCDEGFDDWEAKDDNPFWYVMNQMDFMTFNIAHIYKHFTGGGCGARSLFDVYLYMTRCRDRIDLCSFENRLAKEGLLDFYRRIIHLSYFWFGEAEQMPVEPDEAYVKGGEPTELLLETEYFITSGGSYGNIDNNVAYGVNTQGKLRFILGLAFPRYRNMCALFPWLRKFPIGLPFAYVFRWFKALFNGRMGLFVRAVKKSKNSNIT